jgi:hypothetical protein
VKKEQEDYPEIAVTRERLSAHFDPPLAKSTFYDLVNRGKIQPVSGVRGYFRLNASLQRMGLPPVKSLTPEASPRIEDSGYRDLALLALQALMEMLKASITSMPSFRTQECRVSPLLITSPWEKSLRSNCWHRLAGQ